MAQWFVLLFCSFSLLVLGIFAILFYFYTGLQQEQVGVYDWHEKFIGNVKSIAYTEHPGFPAGYLLASDKSIGFVSVNGELSIY